LSFITAYLPKQMSEDEVKPPSLSDAEVGAAA